MFPLEQDVLKGWWGLSEYGKICPDQSCSVEKYVYKNAIVLFREQGCMSGLYLRSMTFRVHMYEKRSCLGSKREARVNSHGSALWPPGNQIWQKQVEFHGSTGLGHVSGDVRHFMFTPASSGVAHVATIILLCMYSKPEE